MSARTTERKGFAAKVGQSLNRAPTAPQPFKRNGKGIRFSKGERIVGKDRTEVDQPQSAQGLLEKVEAFADMCDVKFGGIDAKLTAEAARRGAKQAAPQRFSTLAASMEDLLDEFDGEEAVRFHHCGYTMEAARHEHRQMQRRPTTERRMVRS